MRHTREILRHKWLLGSSHRLVTSSLAVSHGAITDTTQRAVRAGLDWDSVCALADSELERLLYPPPPSAGTLRPEPDFVTIDLELRRKGVTLELLGVSGAAPRVLPALLLLRALRDVKRPAA